MSCLRDFVIAVCSFGMKTRTFQASNLIENPRIPGLVKKLGRGQRILVQGLKGFCSFSLVRGDVFFFFCVFAFGVFLLF